MEQFVKFILNLALHLTAVVVLAWLFWPFLNHAIHAPKLSGFDAEQFIFYVSYYSRSFSLPPAGWDHLWYEGVPRVLDTTFLQYYFIQPLVAKLGLAMATKVYPLIWLGIFFLFSYLIFFRLSKNQIIALSLTAGLINSRSVYLQIYEKGVVTSALAQMIFPLVLFFLVLFVQTRSFRYLVSAAIALAFQFHSHGALALVFGLIPAILFLISCRVQDEKLLSWIRVRRVLVLISITLGVGAIAILPQVFDALGGGIYGQFPFGQVETQTRVFTILLKETNPTLLVGLGLAGLMAILFHKRQEPGHLIGPLSALLAYFLTFQITMVFGINPIGDFLFPARSFWFFGLIVAALGALLLAPLTQPLKRGVQFFFPLGWLSISGIIMAIVLTNQLQITKLLPPPTQILPDKVQRDTELLSTYKTRLTGIWDQIDQKDQDFRVWIHAFPKIYWNIISDLPQAEGYFHYSSKYSDNWMAWLFATLAEETVENQTIPQDMADKQALFLIDWYGIKYLIPYPGPENNLAPRFWEENEYILKRSAEGPPAVLTMRPEFTSGIVEAVDVPIVGFVGSDEGYDTFLRDLGMLNLNTHYLIPLRLTPSIDKLSSTDLDKVDLLVLYNFKGGGRSWRNIAEFVEKGGNLFIETGGDSSLREGSDLPEVFPADQLEFGSLGRDWQVEAKEELSAINFETLEPLVYQGEPWKVSYVPDTRFIRERSKVSLTQAGKPVVVERQIGQGRIIWSGLNSWYRPWEFKENGMVEVQVLEVLLKKLIETAYHPPIGVTVTREKPERITVEGDRFSGVVFKENHLPGWKAWVDVNSKKQKLKIYSAGPDFMYVKMPKDLEGRSSRVEFVYYGRWQYWLLFVISVASLGAALFEVVTNGFLTRRVRSSRIGRFLGVERLVRDLKRWWERE